MIYSLGITPYKQEIPHRSVHDRLFAETNKVEISLGRLIHRYFGTWSYSRDWEAWDTKAAGEVPRAKIACRFWSGQEVLWYDFLTTYDLLMGLFYPPFRATGMEWLYTDPDIFEKYLDTWTKLIVFSLTEYERVVLLDSDMLVMKNMDELMDIPLNPDGNRVFAASHACVCNPFKQTHYPANW